MKDKSIIIEEIKRLLPEASLDDLIFVFFYLLKK